ncbi:MAG: hypothetical protein ACKOXQ_04385 [Hydrogenophaga sp.]
MSYLSRHQFSLEEAVSAAPSLAALQEQVRASQSCLKRIEHLIPAPLWRQIHAGPIQGEEWCLLVSHTAAATKLRQLVPLFLQALAQESPAVSTIRIKVQAPNA